MESQISFTVPEYAARHSVSKATVFRWIQTGKIDSIKVGHLRRITIEHERDFLTKYHSSNSGGQDDE